MSTPDSLLETLRELLSATNPGLVTKEDLREIEDRLDELEELVDAIEERLGSS